MSTHEHDSRPPTHPAGGHPSAAHTGQGTHAGAGGVSHRAPEEIIAIPRFSLIVLMGASSSGKSSFAKTWFPPATIVSAERCRYMVVGDENAEWASAEAFALLETWVTARLKLGQLTLVDASGLEPRFRLRMLDLAREFHAPAILIALDLTVQTCQENDRGRVRSPGTDNIERQVQRLARALSKVREEGWNRVVRLREADLKRTRIEIRPLRVDCTVPPPYDLIGDVHGCFGELTELLGRLGYRKDERAGFRHPQGRRVVFVGDLIDRGPASLKVLQLAMQMHKAGTALMTPGNHDDKLLRYLAGGRVRLDHGFERTVAELEALTPEARTKLLDELMPWLKSLPPYLILDEGKLVVAHAGLPEHLQGRLSRAVMAWALFGEARTYRPAPGQPERVEWPVTYQGKALVIYGHTPSGEARRRGNTLCIDQGCVFGGKLTSYRYPEGELVQVKALETWYPNDAPDLDGFSAPEPEAGAAAPSGESSAETSGQNPEASSDSGDGSSDDGTLQAWMSVGEAVTETSSGAAALEAPASVGLAPAAAQAPTAQAPAAGRAEKAGSALGTDGSDFPGELRQETAATVASVPATEISRPADLPMDRVEAPREPAPAIASEPAAYDVSSASELAEAAAGLETATTGGSPALPTTEADDPEEGALDDAPAARAAERLRAGAGAGAGAGTGAGTGGLKAPMQPDLPRLLTGQGLKTRWTDPWSPRAQDVAAALEQLSDSTIDPRWLIYIPPSFAVANASQRAGLLEHPTEVLQLYRSVGLPLVFEEMQIGVRGVFIVGIDEDACEAHFGIRAPGMVYDGQGRSFFDARLQSAVLATLQQALKDGGAFERLDARILIFEGLVQPWSLKRQEFLARLSLPAANALFGSRGKALEALELAMQRRIPVKPLRDAAARDREAALQAQKALQACSWPVKGVEAIKIAPIQLLATEKRTFWSEDRRFQAQELDRWVETSPQLVPTRRVFVGGYEHERQVMDLWESIQQSRGAGLVARTLDPMPRHAGRLEVPAMKVRARDFLRVVYGPQYLNPDMLQWLRERPVRQLRAASAREWALAAEGLEMFAKGGGFASYHPFVLAVLASQQEVTDPRR